ncbi:MAG: 16S rRNA (guanine(527)-N(7))-methyltransferase RsmG [Novosphingobium sp.]|nr:16S rRNA (guanine(527)-N(7))-methyltransferase RsmG [Novosphingobium sp.]
MLDSESQARDWFKEALGCDTTTLKKFDQLVALLRAENARQNLVSAASMEHVWVRHLADSAQLLVSRETPVGPWLDLGSGAGFPGLIIALCRPALEVILVENRARRIAWLEQAAVELGLANVTVAGKKLEALPALGAGTISARAFAPLPQLIALSARFSTPETLWLLPKGRNGRQELLQMPKPIQAMFHVEQSLTDVDSVILVGRGIPRLAGGQRR